nr:hypothetical protein [Syntrophorhabdus aromaticivorans]
MRQKEIERTREAKLQRLEAFVSEENTYLAHHRKADPDIAARNITTRIAHLKMDAWVRAVREGRTVQLVVDEKAFENLKERLNVRRLAVSSEQSLDGKLFVQYIALIFLSHITRKMQESNLFKDYTLQEVLDELDVIECLEVPGQRLMAGEMTQRQVELYTKLGVMAPASLQ